MTKAKFILTFILGYNMETVIWRGWTFGREDKNVVGESTGGQDFFLVQGRMSKSSAYRRECPHPPSREKPCFKALISNPKKPINNKVNIFLFQIT